MASFDLIGKVRLQLDQGAINRVASDVNRALQKNVQIGISKLDPKLVKQFNEIDSKVKQLDGSFRSTARSFDAFLNKLRSSEKLTQRQKNRFVKRGESIFSAFALNPEAFEQNFKDEEQKLKQAVSAQEANNKRLKQLRKLREDAKDIADPRARGGITRSLKSLRSKSGLEFQEGVARVGAKIDSSRSAGLERIQAAEKQRKAEAAERKLRAREDDDEVRASQEEHQKREGIARDAVLANQKAQTIATKRNQALQKSVNQRVSVRDRDTETSGRFGEQSALAFRRFAAFSLAAGAVFELVSAFRTGIKEAVSFEAELVKLAQVSNSSVKAVGATSDEITRLSTSLGVSSKDLLASAVTIRQAGFSADETTAALETLSKTTLSPSFEDLKNTTEGLIALRSQFNTTADDFKRQFSEINAVSKAFAVEAEDIVTAIRKTGGAFKVAGGDVTQLISLFTAVRSTTRESADTIATGFRTIFGRLQRPQVIDELKSFGIELRKSTGEFVGPLEAIKKLNQALANVGQPGNLQFARIAEQVGGIRQISKVIPLIQQFTVAQRAANIARIGANSLDEDAAIAQQSLANRLTKTREKFFEFTRTLTINSGFKDLIGNLLSVADSISTLGNVVARELPTILTLFTIGQAPQIGRFGAGFANRIGLGGGRANGLGTQLALSGAFGGGRFGAFRLGKRFGLSAAATSKVLNVGVPAAALGLGLGGIAAGDAIAGNNPLQRNRFVGGRTVAGVSTGSLGGAIAGFSLTSGNPVGAAVGAVLGGATAGINAFTNALQEATDALEESKFRPAFERLTQTLSLVGTGRLSPGGRRAILQEGIQALNERRFTATGAERDQLRGETRQTVEALLLFQQQLADSVTTMTEFNSAGGEDAIKFIAENSVLSEKALQEQTRTSIEARVNLEKTLKALVAVEEGLISQANLITSFGQALSDATIKADNLSDRFNFLSNTAFGNNVGVRFRGLPGFGQNVNNPNLLAGSANQVAGLVGLPQFKGLGQQAVAIANMRQQLPGILSEFAIRRPSGSNTEDLDIFVRDRLRDITKAIPKGAIDLDPIVESIAGSISGELATQGKGLNSAIEDILSAPIKFVDKIFSDTDLTQINQLLVEAAQKFGDRFNIFADQLAEVTTNEIGIRRELVSSLQQQGKVLTEVARIRQPRNFPLATLQANRLAQARSLLGPNAGLAGDPGKIRGFINQTQADIKTKELELQKATEIDQIRSLTETIISLQGEVLGAKEAFGLLIDNSDRIAAKFHEIDRIQVQRDQRRSGAEDFVFGARDRRNQLNMLTAAAQVVAVNPSNFFNENVIPDTLRPLLGEFLNQFSELDILPGLKNRELKDILLQEGARRGGVDNIAAQDVLEGPNAVQRKLLDDITLLTKQETDNRRKFLDDQSQNNKELGSSIQASLEKFIDELRSNLLKSTSENATARLNSVNVRRANAQAQLDQFAFLRQFGGSDQNVNNKKVLELARDARQRTGKGRANALLHNVLSIINTGGIADLGVTDPRLAGNPIFNRLRNLVTDDRRAASIGSRRAAAEGLKGGVQGTEGREIGRNILSNILPDLLLSQFDEKSLVKDLEDQITDVTANGQLITGSALEDIVTGILGKALDKSRENMVTSGEKFATDVGTLTDAENKFFDAIRHLPQKEFDAVATAINKLGDAQLTKVTEQFNKLNLEADALTTTLKGLTDQMNLLNGQPGRGQRVFQDPVNEAVENLRQFLQNLTKELQRSVNGANGVSQTLSNIPRTVELAATHRVEVIVNGAQVLAQLQPGIEQLVITETDKAIQRFASQNLPGIGSFS